MIYTYHLKRRIKNPSTADAVPLPLVKGGKNRLPLHKNGGKRHGKQICKK